MWSQKIRTKQWCVFFAAPVAALRVNVTVVAMEDDVPSARCMAEI